MAKTSDRGRAWIQIHCCVVLWGFTAILGRLISIPAVALVLWRLLLVTVALLLMPSVRRELRGLPRQTAIAYAGVGVLLALHWITLYAAIKLANASVAITCIALLPVFLALTEPKITGRRFDPRELLLGVAVVPGVFLVVGGTPLYMRIGILLGVASTLFAALFSACNKRLLGRSSPFTMTALEMAAGTLFVALGGPLLVGVDGTFVAPGPTDLFWLVVLASACTLLPFVLSLFALRHVTAFGFALAVNLEPVYTIALAIALLNEQRELDGGFYAGVAIIIGAVFIYPVLTRARPRALQKQS
jgi:drug/metabolite transporter (DMT)-like permease